MIAFLLNDGMLPFTGAFLFLAGLVLLEIVSLLLGGSLFGADADGPDIDTPALDAPDLDGLDLGEADLAELGLDGEVELGELAEAEATTGVQGAGGPLAWLGLGEAPFILWLAGMAAAFGVSGYVLQLITSGVFGGLLPAGLAALIAAPPALWGGRILAKVFGKLMPKTETSAVSRRHLGGRLGVITQGTASRGRPAEARVRDRSGAWQYIRVEPREEGVTIPKGTDVIVFRPVGGIYPVMPFGDE